MKSQTDVPVVEVKEVKKRESIRASLILMKEEIDPKVAPGEHIMEVKVKEPKSPVVPVVVEVVEVKEVKPRQSIRASLLLIKEEIDPKIAPGEHIMEVLVPKVAVVAALAPVVEVKEVKPRESIRASLILMKKDIDSSVAPGEHIMEIKVKEPPSTSSSSTAPVSPVATISTAQDLGSIHSTTSVSPPAAIKTTAAAPVQPSTSSGVVAWMKSLF